MYYNVAKFFHNLLSHLLDASSMLWIKKNFPNTNMLLTVDCFEIGVTLMNWWSVVQVDVTVTITNLTIT